VNITHVTLYTLKVVLIILLVQIVHPQKRRNAKKAMNACIGRILEIKGASYVDPHLKFFKAIKWHQQHLRTSTHINSEFF
jgi:hypothetical protein